MDKLSFSPCPSIMVVSTDNGHYRWTISLLLFFNYFWPYSLYYNRLIIRLYKNGRVVFKVVGHENDKAVLEERSRNRSHSRSCSHSCLFTRSLRSHSSFHNRLIVPIPGFAPGLILSRALYVPVHYQVIGPLLSLLLPFFVPVLWFFFEKGKDWWSNFFYIKIF